MKSSQWKSILLKQIKNAVTDNELHKVLSKYPKVVRAAHKEIGLEYDADSQTYNGVQDLGGVTVSNRYDRRCLDNDLSVIIKDL